MTKKDIKGKKRAGYWVIYLMNFFWSVAFALPLYIQSSYIEEIVGIRFVGLVLAASTFLTLLAMLMLPSFLKKFHNYRVTFVVSILIFIVTTLLYLVPGVWSLAFYMVYIALMTVLVICFDIFLERVSDDENTGKIRTIKLLFINTAILISPVISGNLVGWFGSYKLVFLIAGLAFLIIPMLMMTRRAELDDRTATYHKRSLRSLKRIFKTHPNITKSVLIEFALRFFYATMVLYIPIYLYEKVGFDWPTIGLIFTIMLIPFVVLQVPAGRIADKYIGEKEMIIGGIVIMIIFSAVVAVLDSSSVAVWAAVLFMTRVGASVLEAMNEVFFFKHVESNDVDLIDIFRDIRPIGWLSAALVSFIILTVFPGNIADVVWFMIFVLILALYPSSTMKDTK